jgi:photosystem II stability/assembly factor-like uncharacterized protein
MKRIGVLLAILLLSSLPGALGAQDEEVRNLTRSIPAGDYSLLEAGEGYTAIDMEGFGALGEPGEPQLPAQIFLIALPPGAEVRRVEIRGVGPVELKGRYRVVPVKQMVGDDRPLAEAQAEWQASYEAAYLAAGSGDATYPGEVGIFMGQGQWRKYTYARVQFRPFQWQPRSERLQFYTSCTVSMDYVLPEERSAGWRRAQALLSDTVLDGLVAERLINFEQAQAWYRASEGAAAPAAEQYDYVIIVGNNDMVASVASLKAWKEKLGHRVKVVTLNWIYQNYKGCYNYGLYKGCDKAAQILEFLNDKWPAAKWGIRYVLLVGDVDVIPMRVLYPDGAEGSGRGYGSDYYYAKPSMTVWDHDNDRRWGEFYQDKLDFTPDVIVGRIPFNGTAQVQTICNNIVQFEQDTGAWKHNVLLAHGFADYNDEAAPYRTDTAVLGQALIEDFFSPLGWQTTTLYQRSGLPAGWSNYVPSYPLSEANFIKYSQPQGQSLINVAAHGSPDHFAGAYWKVDKNGNGQPDCPKPGCHDEWGWIEYDWLHNITAPNFSSAVVVLNGCSTGPLLGADVAAGKRSLDLVTTTKNSIGKQHMRAGAVGVIASMTGSDYGPNWKTPQERGSQSLNYYFIDHLVDHDKKVGDAFFEAHLDYVTRHPPQRGIRTFNYFGDPALTLKGVADRPGGTDSQIHEGSYRDFSADTMMDGTIFVAVLTSNAYQNEPGEIKIYKSVNHGQTWTSFATIQDAVKGFFDVEVIVAEADDWLLVFYPDSDGELWVRRYPLTGGGPDIVSIATWGPSSNYRLPHVSAAGYPHASEVWVACSVHDLRPPPSAGDPSVAVYGSGDYGSSWFDGPVYQGYDEPSIEFTPYGHDIYLAAVETTSPNDVVLKISNDAGVSWGAWQNLTGGDGAAQHKGPVVATATGGSVSPLAFWVAYEYILGSQLHGEVRYAHCRGSTCTKDRTLAGFGKTKAPAAAFAGPVNMRGYKFAANAWMNAAFVYNPGGKTGIVWRYAHNTTPGSWSYLRVVNDFEPVLEDVPPRVAYSPGATGTGSGVVYATTNHGIRYSAPWLTPRAAPAEAPARAASPNETLAEPMPPVIQTTELSPLWQETADLEGVFVASALLRTEPGLLYASGVADAGPERNEGAIYRSEDGGETWERIGELEGSWSLSTLAQAPDDALLAGGTWLEGDLVQGAIYRSEDGGGTWVPVLLFPEGTVYDLAVTDEGDVYAATGWQGLVFLSVDNGIEWEVDAAFGEGVEVYAFLGASNGFLYAGLAEPEGVGQIMRSKDWGQSWHPVEGLEGTTAVYDLLELEGRLYAGVRAEDGARVYTSDLDGWSWAPTAALPDEEVLAVHSLLALSEGGFLAGAETELGPSFTRVYITGNQGEYWEPLCGAIDLATTVNDLAFAGDRIFAATGHVYGNVYVCGLGPFPDWQVYLPLIRRE